MRKLSIVTLSFTVLTVLFGAIVRVSGSSLGCPDWPLCHGRIIPPSDLNAWIEWAHRTVAALAAVVMLLFVARAYLSTKKKSFFILIAILIGQIVLGAITVKTDVSQVVAILHTVTAVLFSYFVVRSCSFFLVNKSIAHSSLKDMLDISLTCLIVTIVTGAIVTRTGAALSSTDIPIPFSFADDRNLLILQVIQTLHRIIAYVSFGLIMYFSHKIMRTKDLRLFGLLITMMVTTQVILGLLNIYLKLDSAVRVFHITFAFGLLMVFSALKYKVISHE